MRKQFIFLVVVIITMMSCGNNNTQKARVPIKESAQKVIILTSHDTASLPAAEMFRRFDQAGEMLMRERFLVM